MLKKIIPVRLHGVKWLKKIIPVRLHGVKK